MKPFALVGKIAKSTVKLSLKGVWALLRLSVRALIAVLVRAKRGVTIARLIVNSRSREVAGTLICPRGHRTPLAGVWRCNACGFVYEHERGALRCMNPECKATSVFVTCVVCGLGILNPYRTKVKP